MSEIIKIETEFNGKKIKIETGKVAKKCNGSIWLQYGKMTILAAIVINLEKKSEQPYVPLSVSYLEKDYSKGLITGPHIKRESPATLHQIITSRIIDRPIRPLFPSEYRNETNVECVLLSNDPAIPADTMVITAVSTALSVSEAPYASPMAGVRVCKKNGEFIVNPDFLSLKDSDFQVFVAGTENGITMIESEGRESSKEDLLNSIEIAEKNIKELVNIQKSFIEKINIKPKISVPDNIEDSELYKKIYFKYESEHKNIFSNDGKVFKNNLGDYLKILKNQYSAENKDDVLLNAILKKIKYSRYRKFIFESEKRLDNRKLSELRNISCERGLLPSAHGSALFSRGETQSLAVTTIGAGKKENSITDSDKLFFLHYNFPGFSVGDSKKKNSVSRREYGHGYLAEKSLKPIMPKTKDYNHTIRVVSEILGSDGSSSMASVCGGSISLKDAGVPINRMAAGISVGLIKEDEKFVLLTDIDELEDHCGDMDFKVAGTAKGITGVQLDIKISNINLDIIEKTFKSAETARMEILEKMEVLF
ncbi:MAG TPA: polyribonucleotide nucleotidyltransferase [bacterium]|nr:polyribonucleotide nucleotidyltransferase [bacterium]HPN31902.1 polyribonucleotide nucleotidyltransferase [bacterium]